MKFKLRTLLYVVGSMALLLAMSAKLHQRFKADETIIEKIERKYGLPTMVVNLSHQPRHSGGYHRIENGRLVTTAIKAWGDDTTPRWAGFLPKLVKIYCFSRITSVSIDSDVVPQDLLTDLTQLSGLTHVSFAEGSVEVDTLRKIRESYPQITFEPWPKFDWDDEF